MASAMASEGLDGVGNGLRHGHSADFGFALFTSEDVASAQAGVDGFIHGCLDGMCCGGFTERVAQHHCSGEDLGNGVGDSLASDVGC